jgi:nucleotide-binding universal stress UspA family protein
MADERDIDPRLQQFAGDHVEAEHSAPRPDPATAELRRSDDIAVVIGLDGSSTSWDAFWWGCGQARRLNRRAVAVFVSPTIDAGTGLALALGCFFDCEDVDRRATAQAIELAGEVHRHAAEHGFDVLFVHARGDRAQELLRVAEAVQSDLIVIGRPTRALHHLAGSLGRRLIGQSKAPVVAVVP